ncbi:MAG: DNA polymerase III subunit beta [Nitrospiraceae bacterium]|nr:DNA polymerase III subunit beta [Nitrospiraceae bacterium]
MKIVVTKEEMLSKLSTIQNIVEKKNAMPILSHFLLDAGRQGSSITATDLDTALREPLNVTVEKEGRICVPARKMFEIVKEVEGDLTLETIDDQWLKMKAGAGSFRLACLSAKEFPAWPGMEDMQELTIRSSVLVEAIEKTVYASGETDTRYTLNGLLFHFQDGNRLTVVGTDGHRLAILVREIAGAVNGDQKLIIPRKASNELRKLLDKRDDEVRISIGQNHVLFSVGDIQFLTRLIEGTYPNYEQVIPANNDKSVVINRDILARTIRRVAIMSKEQTRAVKVDFSENTMKISSSNPDIGEAQDEIGIQYSGEGLTLGFNARYLLDILEVMDSETVILEMQAQLSPVLVRDEKDGQYRCVIMPMRI